MKFNRIVAALSLLLALVAAPARAADWNSGYGMGGTDEYQFSGSGVPFSVVTSVHSNAVYYITSANNSGGARIDRVLTKSDLTGFNLDFYVATNSWTCASNQPAGTNIIWLTSTNNAMATNDVLVFRGSGESYQLLIVSGNATDARGTVYTNASGYVGIKVFNTPTNVVTAGDTIYKMARLTRFNPLSDYTVTNVVPSPWANWLNLNLLTGGDGINLRGKVGSPTALVMTYSNAGSLYLSGDYFVRQRR